MKLSDKVILLSRITGQHLFMINGYGVRYQEDAPFPEALFIWWCKRSETWSGNPDQFDKFFGGDHEVVGANPNDTPDDRQK